MTKEKEDLRKALENFVNILQEKGFIYKDKEDLREEIEQSICIDKRKKLFIGLLQVVRAEMISKGIVKAHLKINNTKLDSLLMNSSFFTFNDIIDELLT